MKLISLTQPWASLVAAGIKRFETRQWNTAYRGDLAIHATKGPVDLEALSSICSVVPEAASIAYPHGAVLAVVRLASCDEMTQAIIWSTDDRELALGDWRPGRYALQLDQLRPLERPLDIPAGSRGRPIAIDIEVEHLIRSRL